MALRGIEGKVAVVTGGGSGIGEGAARRLSEDGAELVIVAGAPLGVRVNTVAPGVIVTGLMKNLEEHLGTSDEAQRHLEANIPAGRFGSKEEAGDLVAYLLSDEASYISGAVITLDGGVAANNPLTPPRDVADA